jgi:hypothetical protein
MSLDSVNKLHYSISYRYLGVHTTSRGFSLGVKRQGREAEHSPRTIAEVKKTWIYTSTPPYALMT